MSTSKRFWAEAWDKDRQIPMPGEGPENDFTFHTFHEAVAAAIHGYTNLFQARYRTAEDAPRSSDDFFHVTVIDKTMLDSTGDSNSPSVVFVMGRPDNYCTYPGNLHGEKGA